MSLGSQFYVVICHRDEIVPEYPYIQFYDVLPVAADSLQSSWKILANKHVQMVGERPTITSTKIKDDRQWCTGYGTKFVKREASVAKHVKSQT